MTSRLLLEGGFTRFSYYHAGGPGQLPPDGIFDIGVQEQSTAINPATGLPYAPRGNYNYRALSQYNDNYGNPNNWRASAAYVTGSHNMKVGYQGSYLLATTNILRNPSLLNYRFNRGVPNAVSYYLPDFGRRTIKDWGKDSADWFVEFLKPFLEAAGLKRVIYTTFQSVSGAGEAGREALRTELRGDAAEHSPFSRTIRGNAIPQIGVDEKSHFNKRRGQKLFNLNARLNQILDKALIESTLMIEFRNLSDLIHDTGLLNYMLFSLLEGIVDYDAAAVFYNDRSKEPRVFTLHVPENKTQSAADVDNLKDAFFTGLLDRHPYLGRFDRFEAEVIGEASADAPSAGYKTVYRKDILDQGNLIGAIALYSREEISYENIFPVNLIEDELHIALQGLGLGIQ